jgi:hypothetical protein
MTQKAVQVRIDDRVRLMSAVLAATNYPEKEQKETNHRPHIHARNTTKRVLQHAQHPAVTSTQVLLDQGAPLEAFFTFALKLSWPDLESRQVPRWVPPKWNLHLRNFYEVTELDAWWRDEDAEWQKARQQSTDVLSKVDFYEFLKPFAGQVVEQLVFMPSNSFPSTRSIGVRIGGELICISPPRPAWGDNAPWPFDEEPAYIFANALSDYARLLMLSYLRQHADKVAPIAQKSLPVSDKFTETYPTWGDQFTELFAAGAVALFLEQSVSKQEAKSYILMQHKAKGLGVLPGVVSVLRRYLNEFNEGKYESFINYLPNFPGHLRVAKTITTI